MKSIHVLLCSSLLFAGFASEGVVVSGQKRRRPPVAAQPLPRKTLTRDHAAQLIKQHPNFRSLENVSVPIGTFWYDYRSMENSFGSPGLFESIIQPLVESHIVTFRETRKSYAVWWREYVVELTPTGETQAKEWLKAPTREWVLKYQGPVGPESPNVTLFHVPVAERNLVQVTGIALDADGTRGHVEFTWNWAATAHGRLFPKKLASGELHAGAVRVQLYDDGWRMGEIVVDVPFAPQPQPVSATTPEPSVKWERAQSDLSAPKLLAPGNGTVFDHYPRNTALKWKPVPGASSYSIEVQFLSGEGTEAEWCDSFEIVGPQLRAMNLLV